MFPNKHHHEWRLHKLVLGRNNPTLLEHLSRVAALFLILLSFFDKILWIFAILVYKFVFFKLCLTA